MSPLHRLGPSGPEVSALGIGTWALGGPSTFDGRDAGWGEVDDDVSVAAIHTALDHGVRLVDTAGQYGSGHAERVIGRALRESPYDGVVVSTKFGLVFDEATRIGGGTDVSPAAIRAECDASRRRLARDALDVYQLHGGARTTAEAEDVVATLESLVDEGAVRWIATAQHDPWVINVFARSRHCVSVQTQLNVFGWSADVLATARRHGLGILARSPLAMGLLGGRYTADRRPPAGDVRLDTPWWTYFDDDAIDDWLARLDAVRDLLRDGGRSLVQGSLGYLWALGDEIVPLPGVRTVEQATENARAMEYGALPADVAARITDLLADSPERV